MRAGSTKSRVVLLAICAASFVLAAAQTGAPRVAGTVFDPAGRPVAGARVLLESANGAEFIVTTGNDGSFSVALSAWGSYTVRAEAAGFAPITRKLQLTGDTASQQLRFDQVAAAAEEVIVTADVSEIALTAPDPSQKVMVREQLLDANPGHDVADVAGP